MQTSKRIIIGIDPGSRCTGYGLIWMDKSQYGAIDYGFIRCQQATLGQRLYHIYQQLSEKISQHQPHEAAIEQVFTCINPQSALKLGQARGAALTAAACFALPVTEYSARQIKKAAVGYGAANKNQVQHMVRSLLKLTVTPQVDAADALAIAICHANHRQLQQVLTKGNVQ
jgi:crossover junction endodeoxyribonuclease RuvC